MTKDSVFVDRAGTETLADEMREKLIEDVPARVLFLTCYLNSI